MMESGAPLSGTSKVARLVLLLAAGLTFAEIDARAGNTGYGYDGQGRLAGVVLSSGSVIAYGYDAAGNRSATFFGPVDSDGDGVPDYADNCIDTPNVDQAEGNLGFGVACDTFCYAPDCSIRCDLNGDNKVGAPDFTGLLDQIGRDCTPEGLSTDCTADCTGDGRVGSPDFSLLIAELGNDLAGPQGPLSGLDLWPPPTASVAGALQASDLGSPELHVRDGKGAAVSNNADLGSTSSNAQVPGLNPWGLVLLSVSLAWLVKFARGVGGRGWRK